jgi:Fic family protein
VETTLVIEKGITIGGKPLKDHRLVGIHPFNDGNGWTAQLLMNLILIRGGYPPIAMRPEDRLAYTRALERSQTGQRTEDFDKLLYERLDATLAEYLRALEEAAPHGAGVDHPPE